MSIEIGASGRQFDHFLLLTIDPACENDDVKLPRLKHEVHKRSIGLKCVEMVFTIRCSVRRGNGLGLSLRRQLVVGVRVERFELNVRRRNLIRFGPNLGSARCGKWRDSQGFRVR